VYVIPHFFQKLLERTDGKNNKIFNFRTGENPVFMGFLSGANSQLYKKFRVLHLRPLGQLSVSIFVRFSFQKFVQKFVGEKTGETAKNIRF